MDNKTRDIVEEVAIHLGIEIDFEGVDYMIYYPDTQDFSASMSLEELLKCLMVMLKEESNRSPHPRDKLLMFKLYNAQTKRGQEGGHYSKEVEYPSEDTEDYLDY